MSFCCPDKSHPIKTFEDVQCHLNRIGLFHMDMGLDRVKHAMHLLGLKMPCPIIQVVGTNGKGSTASFLHSIALSNGFRAGIFTSPHFISPIERIRMNDRLLPQQAWASFTSQAIAVVPDLTYFELITIISLLAFAFSEPDVIIYEAGLGAKHDATTAIPADIVCITPIALEHQAYLGNTLEAIATEKSHAIREKVQAVVSAPQENVVWEVLQKRADSQKIPLYHMGDMTILPEELREKALKHKGNYGLKGAHQECNAQVAAMTWHLLCKKQGWHFEPNAVSNGLADTFIPGRFQQITAKNNLPSLILDGAHNLHSMKSLLATLEEEKITPQAIIFSCLEDKEPQKLVQLLEDYFLEKEIHAPLLLVSIPNNERAMDIKALQKLFFQETHLCKDMQDALEKVTALQKTDFQNTQNPVLICGSLYLLGEYYTLYPHALQPSF